MGLFNACATCGAPGACDHRVLTILPRSVNRDARVYRAAAVCAKCGVGAESKQSAGPRSKGGLTLYETRDPDGSVGSAWFHAGCLPSEP
jgi:hypothetical protein